MGRAVLENAGWMTWNTVLALVPLGLAMLLYGSRRRRTPLWWLGGLTFVVFLPNAPYVLTDAVHLVPDVRRATGTHAVGAVLASYLALFVVGFGAYAACIGLLRQYLRAESRGWLTWPTELALHALCAVGIFLGRFLRFNSWDLVVRPEDLAEYVRVPQPSTIRALVVIFLVLLAGMSGLRVFRAVSGIRVPRAPLG